MQIKPLIWKSKGLNSKYSTGYTTSQNDRNLTITEEQKALDSTIPILVWNSQVMSIHDPTTKDRISGLALESLTSRPLNQH